MLPKPCKANNKLKSHIEEDNIWARFSIAKSISRKNDHVVPPWNHHSNHLVHGHGVIRPHYFLATTAAMVYLE